MRGVRVAALLLSVGTLGASLPLQARKSAISHFVRWQKNNTFDYLIVGGGTAGLVLANRLSETPGIKVVVLEAGIDYSLDPLLNAVVTIPGLTAQGAGADGTAAANILEIDWGFTTVPRESFGNRKIHYERGKTLGGSSSRNFMVYQRGPASSYDAWAALGNEGWDWKGLKPYFDKSVNYLSPDNALRRLAHPTPPDHAFTGCSSSHERRQIPVNSTSIISLPTITATPPIPSSTTSSSAPPQPTSSSTLFGSGPISLSVSPFPQAFGTYMIGAMKELGIPEATSFNNGVLRGVQFCTSTIQQALGKVARSTSRSAYLLQAEVDGQTEGGPERGELVILTQALVKRIIFEKGTTKAIGVVFVSSDPYANFAVPGVEISLYAKKEVIISAGAFQSPQLLMVSGIGPREKLERHGIEVLVDLPGVGQGMQDHIFNGPTFPVSVETFSALAGNVTFQNEQLRNFTAHGLGPFTNPLSDTIGFERLSDETLRLIGAGSLLEAVPEDWPVLEYIISPGFPGNFNNLNSNPSTPKKPVGQQYATILSTVVAPLSRGSISIQSSDMADPPLIDPGWLSSPVDLAVAVAGFRRVRQFFATSFMGQILDGEEIFPGPTTTTDDEVREFVRSNSMTVWHASCTCSMKPREMVGVLDSRLRVHGTTRLRVVDASSFPSLPPGHPQSTIYALAEKASDQIKEDNTCS